MHEQEYAFYLEFFHRSSSSKKISHAHQYTRTHTHTSKGARIEAQSHTNT